MIRNVSKILASILLIVITVILGINAGKYFGQKEKLEKRLLSSKKITQEMTALNIDDTLPNHRFQTIENDSVSLYQLLSNQCVLIISVPQCEECYLEAQQLKSALTDSADGKYFIFVTWENPKLLEDVKRELRLNSPFLYDHKRAYFSRYDIFTFPFNIIVDENGVVLDMLAGAMLKEEFEEIIAFNKLAMPGN